MEQSNDMKQMVFYSLNFSENYNWTKLEKMG